MIIGGTLDDGTEAGLGRRLGISPRHLRRLFNEHLGVTPDQLARSRRAHFARRLLDDSDLAIAEIAFASGFGSLRQFNRTTREVFHASPRELRQRRRCTDRLAADGGLTLRLPFGTPFDWEAMIGFLAARAIPGVEAVESGVYRRTIVIDGDPGVLEVHPGGTDHLLLRAHLPYWEGLIHVVERVGRMFGLDTDLAPAERDLAEDVLLGPLVAAHPGLRVPGAWGPFEVGVQAIVGEHCALDTARERMGRLAERHGPTIPGLTHGLAHAFPSADALATAELGAIGLPQQVTQAVQGFARAVVAGDVQLDGSAALGGLIASVTAVAGVGSGAAQLLALRLGERDAFPSSDPRVRRALGQLAPDAGDTASITESWRPWRSLATMLLLLQVGCATPAEAVT